MKLDPWIVRVNAVKYYQNKKSMSSNSPCLHGFPARIRLEQPDLETDFQTLEAQAVAQLLIGVPFPEELLEHLDGATLYLRRLPRELNLTFEVADLYRQTGKVSTRCGVPHK